MKCPRDSWDKLTGRVRADLSGDGGLQPSALICTVDLEQHECKLQAPSAKLYLHTDFF